MIMIHSFVYVTPSFVTIIYRLSNQIMFKNHFKTQKFFSLTVPFMLITFQKSLYK
jgi:hypothetical protein